MTQKHMRAAAGYGWISRAWLRLHEPRIISAVYGAAYLVAAALGVWTTMAPPQSIEGVTGAALMAIVTCAIAAGGALGVVTVAVGVYWAERTAALLIELGLVVYLGLTIYLQVIGSGNRGLTIMVICFAGLLFGIRFHWIGSRPYNPRIHPVAPEGSGA